MIRRGLAVASLLALLTTTGCVTEAVYRLDPKVPFTLEPYEGLLVVQVDTEFPVSRLMMRGLLIRDYIEKGRHYWITKAPAGSYSWHSVHLAGKKRKSGLYQLQRSKYSREDELDFKVKAGHVNYAGEVIIRDAGYSGRRSYISVRVRNHAAKAIRDLWDTHSHVLRSYPLRNAGPREDRFLEFFSAELARTTREKESLSPQEQQ